MLHALGCPGVRRAEGTDEWQKSRGSYPLTPDLVAGPLVGGGDPSDFYIDVFAPTGDQFVKPQAGNPDAARAFRRTVAERGSIRLDQIDGHEQLYATMNKKLAKYAGSRPSSPMLGLAMHFLMTGNQYVGPVLAGIEAPIALDRAFGIMEHLGRGAMTTVMKTLLSPGESAVILSLPIKQPLSFVLYMAEKIDGVRGIMLVNDAALNPQHAYPHHPVIQWLREMITPDAPTAPNS